MKKEKEKNMKGKEKRKKNRKMKSRKKIGSVKVLKSSQNGCGKKAGMASTNREPSA